MKVTNLIEKWTISKGRDTYGYNVCSLWEKQSQWSTKVCKVATCCGGGYDMQGTVIAEYLKNNYQDRLLKLFDSLPQKHYNDYSYCVDEFYGMTKSKEKNTVHLSGASGLNAMEDIAKAIGITFSRLKINSNQILITLTDNESN